MYIYVYIPRTTNMEPIGSQKRAKVSQGIFENTPCGKVLNKSGKRCVPLPTFGSHFESKVHTNTNKKTIKNRLRKNIEFYA